MKLCLSTLSRQVRAVEVQLHPFLTSVPDGGGLSTSRSFSLPPGKIPRYLHGPHRGSGRFGEEKDVLSQPGIQLRTVQPQAGAITSTSDLSSYVLPYISNYGCQKSTNFVKHTHSLDGKSKTVGDS